MIQEKRSKRLLSLPGARSDYTTPLIIELFNSGQGKQILELLHLASLEVQELKVYPGFRIIRRG